MEVVCVCVGPWKPITEGPAEEPIGGHPTNVLLHIKSLSRSILLMLISLSNQTEIQTHKVDE